jgi:hypothetical protein
MSLFRNNGRSQQSATVHMEVDEEPTSTSAQRVDIDELFGRRRPQTPPHAIDVQALFSRPTPLLPAHEWLFCFFCRCITIL